MPAKLILTFVAGGLMTVGFAAACARRTAPETLQNANSAAEKSMANANATNPLSTIKIDAAANANRSPAVNPRRIDETLGTRR